MSTAAKQKPAKALSLKHLTSSSNKGVFGLCDRPQDTALPHSTKWAVTQHTAQRCITPYSGMADSARVMAEHTARNQERGWLIQPRPISECWLAPVPKKVTEHQLKYHPYWE